MQQNNLTNFTQHEMHTLKCHYQTSIAGITQNVTNKSNVTRHILNTWIRQLPGPGRVVTARYPDPVPGQIPYP